MSLRLWQKIQLASTIKTRQNLWKIGEKEGVSGKGGRRGGCRVEKVVECGEEASKRHSQMEDGQQ